MCMLCCVFRVVCAFFFAVSRRGVVWCGVVFLCCVVLCCLVLCKNTRVVLCCVVLLLYRAVLLRCELCYVVLCCAASYVASCVVSCPLRTVVYQFVPAVVTAQLIGQLQLRVREKIPGPNRVVATLNYGTKKRLDAFA